MEENRSGITHKFCIDGQKGYFTLLFADDMSLVDVKIRISKQGSTAAGFCTVLSELMSMMLRRDPNWFPEIFDLLLNQKFHPMGCTTNRDIPLASSIIDYLARWIEIHYPHLITGKY